MINHTPPFTQYVHRAVCIHPQAPEVHDPHPMCSLRVAPVEGIVQVVKRGVIVNANANACEVPIA